MLADHAQAKLLKKVARGTRHTPGQMNKLEAKYAAWLEMGKMGGNIEWYAFEAITLKLAFDTRYTPDFLVMLPNGELQCHEVKGAKGKSFWSREDSKIKIKVAATLFPFRFFIAWPSMDSWDLKEVSQ